MDRSSKEEVATFLHSVLSCEKGGVPLSRLQEEYTLLIGCPIPYERLGYGSLREFVESIPHAAVIRRRSGEILVEAAVKATTAHMAPLVAGQRSSKPIARPTRHPAPRKGGPSVRFASYQTLVDNQQGGDNLSTPEPHPRSPLGGGGGNNSTTPTPEPRSRSPLNPGIGGCRLQRRHRGLPQLPSTQHGDYRRSPVPPRFQRITSNGHVPAPSEGTASVTNGISAAVIADPSEARTSPRRSQVPPLQPLQPRKILTPPPTPPAKTNRELVEEYAKLHGLTFSLTAMSSLSSKKGPRVWLATLKLPDQTFHSYPEELETQELAEEEAARRAVVALGLHQGFKDLLPRTSVSNPKEVEDFVNRIKKLVAEKPNGLWSTVIPEMYQDSFHESVPKNWLDLVKAARCIYITECKGDRCILSPMPANQPTEVRSSDSDTSSTSGISSEPLSLPNGSYWDVFVTYAPSTDEVFFRLVDHSDNYEQLATEMEQFYTTQSMPVTEFVELAMYATMVDNSWLRVQLLQVSEGKAECYFVDHGDVDAVELSKIQELEHRFLNLPAQAVQCQLEDLLEFAGDDHAAKLLAERVVGRSLVADVVSREDPLSVILYDTMTEEDVNLNALLLKQLMAPVFPAAGVITRARLTHVTPDGNLYVQLGGPSSHALARCMEAVGSHIRETRAQPATVLHESKLYSCREPGGRSFCRALVLSKTPTKVQVKFVDLGMTSWVTPSDLYDLEAFGDSVTRLPHQALVCQLGDILNGPWTEKATARLKEMVPSDLELLLKVTTAARDGCPAVVALFKRIEPDNELVSIDTSLAVSLQETRSEDKANRPRRTSSLGRALSQGSFDKKLDVSAQLDGSSSSVSPNSGSEEVSPCILALEEAGEAEGPPLVAPTLPPVGEYLDVVVMVAASPLNFSCQPWLGGGQLEALMADMQAFYTKDNAFPEGLPEALLSRGRYYAGKHTDGLWYRVRVQQVQKQLMASVYFVDYGDYGMMRPSELQPLWRRFRELPVQAVQASLAGVAPVNHDWNPVDNINFRKLVEERQFVGLIVEKEPDDQTGVMGAHKLVLRLIDTSTDEDVRLDQLLAKMNIARLVE